MILLGAVPTRESLVPEIGPDIVGSESLLQRREIGIINVGAPGSVESGGERFELANRSCLYLGRGAETPRFSSVSETEPAYFYAVSVPAHEAHPPGMIEPGEAQIVALGSSDSANERKLHKYIHPGGLKSCQLVMGFTELGRGSVWNTMPAHTHLRRTEAYLYFDVDPDQLVFHFMGEGDQTRHVVVRNREAVLSPSWSIHAGAGTAPYAFVWAMAGENQDFTDMDHLALSDMA